MNRRAGLSLVELMIALVITAVITSAMIAVFISQSRLYGQQESARSARAVSRTGANVLLVDLRMVESTGGVESASASSVTLRVPYAIGIICATSAAETIISLLPVDSMLFARPGYSGFAWRDAAGDYSYVAGSQDDPDVVGSASDCTDQSISVLDSGLAVRLTPGVESVLGAEPGTPVLLYRRTRYEFAPAGLLDGDSALIRTFLEGGEPAILAGPVGGSSHFRFFVGGDPDSQETPPADLSTIRGLEVYIEGKGNRPAAPGQPPADAPVETAIFFNNAP